MYPIHTLFSNCALYYFRGCITQLVVWMFKASGFLRGMISIVQIYIFLVYLYWFFLVEARINFSLCPVMAIVTYILLTALHSGINERFHPQVCACAFRPQMIQKSSCYIFRFLANQPPVQQPSFSSIFVLLNWAVISWIFRDHLKSLISSLMAVINLLGTYIYTFSMMVTYDPNLISSVILSLAAGFLGATGILWTLIFVYAFLSNAFFLVRLFICLPRPCFLTFAAQLRSLRSVVLPDTSSVPPTHAIAKIGSAQRRRRIIFLFLEAVTQVLYMTWLVRI